MRKKRDKKPAEVGFLGDGNYINNVSMMIKIIMTIIPKTTRQPIFMVWRKQPSRDGCLCFLKTRPHEGHVGAWSEIWWLQSGQVLRGMGVSCVNGLSAGDLSAGLKVVFVDPAVREKKRFDLKPVALFLRRPYELASLILTEQF